MTNVEGKPGSGTPEGKPTPSGGGPQGGGVEGK